MDEPIANLDTQSEKEISDILKNLEYSVVAVSHRNEVFNEYMKVYRMENGKLEKESVWIDWIYRIIKKLNKLF